MTQEVQLFVINSHFQEHRSKLGIYPSVIREECLGPRRGGPGTVAVVHVGSEEDKVFLWR